MTPSDVITEVRRIIQDSRTPYRYTDAELLGYVNQTLKRMATLRPDLFADIVDITPEADTAIQKLPDEAIRLMDIFQVKGGTAVTEADREAMSRADPDWMTATSGTPVNFMRHVKNGKRYFLYPPPSSGTVLIGEYAVSPEVLTINDEIEVIPEAYYATLIDGTVFLAESIDDEHVNSNRAKLFLDSFMQQMGTAIQSREVTDTKAAGMQPEQVL